MSKHNGRARRESSKSQSSKLSRSGRRLVRRGQVRLSMLIITSLNQASWDENHGVRITPHESRDDWLECGVPTSRVQRPSFAA